MYSSYLAEDDGHQEEVKQQRLGQMPMVQGEEEDSEEDGDVLVSRTAVGGAKQLQARHCDHKGANPDGGGGDRHVELKLFYCIIYEYLSTNI